MQIAIHSDEKDASTGEKAQSNSDSINLDYLLSN